MNKFALIGLSLMLGFIGVALWVVAIVGLVQGTRDTGFYLAAPGNTTIQITKPGHYTLWNQTAGIVAGQFKTFPSNMPPNMTITATSKVDGKQIQMQSSMNESEEINGTRRNAIASFVFDTPGEFVVNVSGFSEQRCFYLDQAKFLRAFLTMIMGGLGGMVFVVAGIALGIYSIIQLSKNKTPLKT